MTKYCIVWLWFVCSCSEGQSTGREKTPVRGFEDINQQAAADSSENKITGDTLFIHKEVTKEYYHAIYIDTTRQSKFYNWLTDFEFDEDELQSYKENYAYFEERRSTPQKKGNKANLPKDWIPVYQYKNQYYLYAPSDWGNAGKRIINDSAFVYWYMDGPSPMPISSINKREENIVSIEIEPFKPNSTPQKLNIYQIDPKTKLSVFEYANETGKYRYRLYIPKESAAHFDMVVNYCPNRKQLEYDFDEINFEELVKKAANKTKKK